MREDEIRRLSANGVAMANVLPYIEDTIAGMVRALDHRMFSAIASGQLTPDMALEGWAERAAYSNLLKQFQTVVRMGESPEGGLLKFKK